MYHSINEYRVYLKKKLMEDRQGILDAWAAGNFTRESVEGTVQINSKYLGFVECLDEIIGYLEEPIENLDDEVE